MTRQPCQPPNALANAAPRCSVAAWAAVWAAVWVAVWALLLPGRCLAQTPQSPAQAEQILRRLGLAESNGQWRFQEEPLLRRRLQQLDELRVEFLSMHRLLTKIRTENEARWLSIQRQVEALQKRISAQPTESKERRKLEGKVKKLKQTAMPPDKLGCSPAVRPRLKKLLALELDGLRYLHWSRRTLAMVRERYPVLQANAMVEKCLRLLGGTLGSADPFRDADDILNGLRPFLDKPQVAAYEQAGRTRLGLVINETYPITASHQAGGRMLLLAADAAQTVQARPDRNRQPLRVTLQKRVFTATPVVVSMLRLGSKTAEDVEAWRLPAEAADLGSVVGELAVKHWRIELQPRTMRAVAQSR